MLHFLGDAVGKHGLVDVRGHGGEDQTLKLDQLHIGRSGYWNLRSY
ncbi:hypothetical protein ACFZDJ_29290 [Streptomyces sp. NPDC007896]